MYQQSVDDVTKPTIGMKKYRIAEMPVIFLFLFYLLSVNTS